MRGHYRSGLQPAIESGGLTGNDCNKPRIGPGFVQTRRPDGHRLTREGRLFHELSHLKLEKNEKIDIPADRSFHQKRTNRPSRFYRVRKSLSIDFFEKRRNFRFFGKNFTYLDMQPRN